jgi:hypothetical protein
MVALPGWYLHFNGLPGRFHIVCVSSSLVHKLLAVIDRMVRVLQAHMPLYAPQQSKMMVVPGLINLSELVCQNRQSWPIRHTLKEFLPLDQW